MLAIPSSLFALLGAAALEDGNEVDVAQELQALIERTNALETFHVIYEVEDASQVDLGGRRFELVYRAPDLGRFRIMDEKQAVVADAWMTASGAYFQDDAGDWKRCDYPERSQASHVLDGLFPPRERPLEPGCAFSWDIRETGDDEEGLKLHMGALWQRDGRTTVLGWLEHWKKRATEVAVEGNSFVLEGPNHSIRLSRQTGFPESIRFSREKGESTVRLRECRLDEPLDEELVAIPQEALDAEISPEFTAMFQKMFGPGVLRETAFLRVEHQLTEGSREWDGLARNDWRSFLDALHRQTIGERYTTWLAELDQNIDERAEWVRTQRREDPSPERLAQIGQHVAESRTKMEEQITAARAKYVDSLPPIESPHAEPRQELFDLEIEVIDELWTELLIDPVLERFDEELSAALGK